MNVLIKIILVILSNNLIYGFKYIESTWNDIRIINDENQIHARSLEKLDDNDSLMSNSSSINQENIIIEKNQSSNASFELVNSKLGSIYNVTDPHDLFDLSDFNQEEKDFIKADDILYYNFLFNKMSSNYNKGKQLFLKRMRSPITVFKGRWNIEGSILAPYLQATEGDIYILIEFIKLINMNGNFMYLFEIMYKVYGDSLDNNDILLNYSNSNKYKYHKDSYLLLRRSPDVRIPVSNIKYVNDDLFQLRNFQSTITEVNFIDFLKTECKHNLYLILDFNLTINMNCIIKNETIFGLEGNLTQSNPAQNDNQFVISYSANRLLQQEEKFDTYHNLILSNSILQLFNIIYISIYLYKYESDIKQICMYTLLANSLWNCYSIISHFYLILNFEPRFSTYGIPLLLILISMGFELRLIFKIFTKYNPDTPEYRQIMKKKLIIFYTTFHIILLLLIYNANFFIFHDRGIIISAVLMYLPYIYSNSLQTKIKHPPLFLLFALSYNRFYLPVYFKTVHDNVYHIHSNPDLMISISLILLTQHIFMYLQTYFGGNFYLCAFVKSRLGIKPSESNVKFINFTNYMVNILKYKNTECFICLNPFEEDSIQISKKKVMKQSKKYSEINSDLASIDTTSTNIDSHLDVSLESDKSETKFDEFQDEINTKTIIKTMVLNCYKVFKNIFSVAFYFHSFNKNINYEKIVVTECNHVFHKECIEKWVLVKGECPMDRSKIIIEYC